MSTYILIFTFVSLLAYGLTNYRSQVAVLFVFANFLILFAGTRFDTGCDFWGYLQRFNNIDPSTTPVDSLLLEEPGFQFIIHTVKYFDLSYMWLNVICTLIIIPCVYRFSKLARDPLILISLLFPIFIVQLSMSGLRQAIAASFLLMAVISFIDKKRLSVIFWLIFGSLFHESVLIFIPIVLVCGKKVEVKRIVYSLLILGPIAAIAMSERASVYNDRYISQIYGESSSSGALFRLALLLVPSLIFEWKKKSFNDSFPYFYPLLRLFSLITIALIPVALISTVAVHRLSYYVLPVQMLTLSLIPYILAKNHQNLMLAKFLPIMMLGLYIVVWFSVSSNANSCYVPYQSYLF